MSSSLRNILLLLFLVVPAGIFLQVRGAERPVYLIRLADEVINPVSAEYISGAIGMAEKNSAECLIIELDTPGGLLTSTRKIVRDIMGAKVPVVVYVSPSGARAGSAGVFITLAANIAAMAPATNIGAAHPVSIGEKRSVGDALEDIVKSLDKKEGKEKAKKVEAEPMEDKILNDTKAWVTGIAKSRGRNVQWAVRSVTESVSIPDDEALKEGVVDIVAADIPELLAALDGRKVDLPEGTVTLKTKGTGVTELPMTWRQRVLMALANPNIAYILLMLGFYGLLFEFTHPGAGFPGVAGVISIVVAFYSLHLLAANYAGVALIVLAIILFIMEIKVVSYGLLTVGGAVSIFLGSLMLFDSPHEFMRVSVPLVLTFTVATLLIAVFLISVSVRSHRKKAATGLEGLIGARAEVRIWQGRRGKVFVHGEIWDACGEESYNKGEEVEIRAVEGMTLTVARRGDSAKTGALRQ